MRLSYRFWRVWYRNMKVWLTYWKASFIGNFLDPLFMILGLGLGLGASIKRIEGMSYIQFLAPGVVASSVMYTATFECTFGTFTRLKPQKTFDSILMTPMMVEEIAAGEIFWGATKGVLTAVSILAVMLVMPFDLIHSWWALLVPFVGLLAGLMFAALALLYTSYSPSYDFFSYYITLALTPMLLLSGIFFPLSNMPEWVQTLAWVLPLTHAVNLSRSLAMGWISPELLWDVLWIAVFTSAVFVIAVRRLKVRLER